MIFSQASIANNMSDPLRDAITHAYRMDEADCLTTLLKAATLSEAAKQRIQTTATHLVEKVRAARVGKGGLDSFLSEYDLSSEEGIALMCLAEALLRVPDAATINKLIRDKIATADWQAHLGQSESVFINAATWGLMLTGKLISNAEAKTSRLTKAVKKLVSRSGELIIRSAVGQAMRILGKQFVMERNINEALKRARELEAKGYLYSYDMLGEAARTQDDAERYFAAYEAAIKTIAKAAKSEDPRQNPGISIKLSALYPRYEFAQHDQAVAIIVPRLLQLALHAKAAHINLCVDAEEADRLDLSLDIIAGVFANEALQGWQGFGLALQSYQKRAWFVIDWLAALSRKHQRRLMLRLIKGAYWDSEIKLAQELGLNSYPVFTRKANTDVSFLACAKKLLSMPDVFFPQFATHNAHSVASVLEMAADRQDYEFQCLHGMGQALYDQIVGEANLNRPCRIYAPVGNHEDLLPYLVRRLLENGANTSFVNRIVDAKAPIAELIADPIARVANLASKPHPKIPLPVDLYGKQRRNSKGIDLTNLADLQTLDQALEQALQQEWVATPTGIEGKDQERKPVTDPSQTQRQVGWVVQATQEQAANAASIAAQVAKDWDRTPVLERAMCLEKAADLFEAHYPELMALLIREAGKTLPDAVAEIREAADFCRYYAMQAKQKLAGAINLPGPTGERNQLSLHGRGPFLCISPWNFPLAIFSGQVVAALVAGNPVLAKPADQTPLIAAYAVRLLHEAGIPQDVLQLVPGRGSVVGAQLVGDPKVKGVAITGSTDTARLINQTLANRPGEIVPLIAETGGLNTMIVDSSALPEQVVLDIIASAFHSAGQRCSALRALFIQEDIAPKLIKMLQGAMAELRVGDPALLATDVGPVIDTAAKKGLEAHKDRMRQEAELIYEVNLGPDTQHGSFVAPCAFELKNLAQLPQEEFGPILHVIRYKANQLDDVIAQINATGYGLTFGVHSRIDETVTYIQQRIHAGNQYVNRNMIGAVVGVQPFGGEGLSGTGPKAGGPHYLYRFCTERTLTINTTAAGGNATLMSIGEEEN